MEMITMQKQKLHTKESLIEMLDTSEADYKDYLKDTNNISRLRDASNKLVAVAEDLTENMTNSRIDGYGDWRKKFSQLKNLSLKGQERELLLARLDSLHIFFYEGLLQDIGKEAIVYNYNWCRKKLYRLIKDA